MRAPVAAALLLAAAGALSVTSKAAPPTNDDCLSCHEKPLVPESVHAEAGLSCTDCHADLAAAELPHGEGLAKVECKSCHDAPAAEYEKSIHAEALRHDGKSLAASCIDCHGTHDIRTSKDADSPTHHLNLPKMCARCHGDPETIRKAGIAIGNVGALYEDSIHGKALSQMGLVVAPNCRSCHGMHDIRRAEDAAAKVFRKNVPATCGSCHEGIQRKYDSGIHGATLRAEGPASARAPVCTDCHTAHHVTDTTTAAWKLDVTKECGSCHEESLHTYRDTYHGQVTALGYARIATCSDCHDAHDIHPAKDPRSTVSAAGRVKTCQKCHPGTNANFAQYDPHADPKDVVRNPMLHYVSRGMKALLFTVFVFFGLHTALWFPRSWKERRRR